MKKLIALITAAAFLAVPAFAQQGTPTPRINPQAQTVQPDGKTAAAPAQKRKRVAQRQRQRTYRAGTTGRQYYRGYAGCDRWALRNLGICLPV